MGQAAKEELEFSRSWSSLLQISIPPFLWRPSSHSPSTAPPSSSRNRSHRSHRSHRDEGEIVLKLFGRRTGLAAGRVAGENKGEI